MSMLSVPSRLSTVDELKAVANRRDLSTFVEHLNAMSTDAGRGRGILASVPDMGDLLMHGADESGTLGALHPIGLRA
jgi:hypothetical protein